jgi:hypothetical protein
LRRELNQKLKMSRHDISSSLVHFTSGETYEAAFRRLQKIVSERKLIAGSNFIKGKFNCVCFSEAPIINLSDGLVNEDAYSRYSPFGLIVDKKWLFALGGRPVIYQSEAEYDLLPESLRWKHVLYETRDKFAQADFTWEREWRIRCESLPFDQNCAKIIVPEKFWADRLIKDFEDAQHYKVMQYSVAFGWNTAEMYREAFLWNILLLNNA